MGSVQTLGVETFPGACRRPRATQFRAPHRAAITRRACSLTSFYPNKISDGAEITGPIALRPLPEPGSAVAQHDPAHWPAADALDAGEKLRVPCPAAAAVVTHLGQDVADFAACTWFTMRSWPHRAHVIRTNHDGNALNGSTSASAPLGSGPVPWRRQ